MTTACLCYSCDKNYLLPTLISSIQARGHLSRMLADVIVIVIGDLPDEDGSVARCFAKNGVKLYNFPRRDIDDKPIMFARHFLDRLLEPHYERIVHIDSDTQIAGSLDPLFKVELPPGKLMASPDPFAIRIDEDGRFWREHRLYFQSIGIPDRQLNRYVNTGLFGARRSDLAAVGRETLKICARSPEPLRFIEQDAVNIAFGDDIELISMKWNFPIFFLNCGFESILRPNVYHYMSNPRPWHGSFRPWGRSEHDIYADTVASEPGLRPYRGQISRRKAAKYWLQQHYKRLLERHTWAKTEIRARLLVLEREALV